MDFDVNTMKRLAAEDKYIEFVFNDLEAKLRCARRRNLENSI